MLNAAWDETACIHSVLWKAALEQQPRACDSRTVWRSPLSNEYQEDH